MEHRTVSFDSELLILVDEQDNVTGYDSKLNVHRGAGQLHRAFSIFLFNGDGQVLLHRRSGEKPLWPGYWTNSCCSHPRKGEDYATAVNRRLREELGVETELLPLYQFKYAAGFDAQGSERELCSVFVGRLDDIGTVAPNATEIAEVRWVDIDDVDEWTAASPELFTPWFLMEWRQLRDAQRPAIARLLDGAVH
jgi:isopentenyl-diphosphate delta-isomerase